MRKGGARGRAEEARRHGGGCAGGLLPFYDLALSTGATISLFVRATKYALKHKGFDIVPGGFTGILERTGGKTERLPAIVDDGESVLDSWGIVEYLDAKYLDRPALIPPPSVAVTLKALDHWFWNAAVGPGLFPLFGLTHSARAILTCSTVRQGKAASTNATPGRHRQARKRSGFRRG